MVCRNRISIFLRPGFRRVNHITIMIPRTGIFHNQASFINSSENPSGQKKRPVPAPRGSSRKAKTGLFHLRICREQEPRFSFCGQQDLNLHGLPLEPKSSASANSAMTACFFSVQWILPFSYAKYKIFVLPCFGLCRLSAEKKSLRSLENSAKSLPVRQLNEASGTRTPDNLIKSQVLYHLS